MKLSMVILLFVCFDFTIAHAYHPPSSFDMALNADRVVIGKAKTVQCDARHPLLCEVSLERDGTREQLGWAPFYTHEPFPILHQDAYFFLKKTETHPHASVWKKKGLVYYMASDPGLSALPLRDPWGPFLADWIKTLGENRKNTKSILDHTARFILTTLARHPDIPSKDGLLFLEGHPAALQDPVPIETLSVLITHPPLGQESEQIRFLDWALQYVRTIPIYHAFLTLIDTPAAPIHLRLHAARLLEEHGKGPPTSFYETLLRSGNPAVIGPTLTVLGSKKTTWSADILYYAMRDLGETHLKERALTALLNLGRDLAVPRLESILGQAIPPQIEFLAIQSLGKFAAASSAGVLAPYLDSPSAPLSLATEAALKRIGTEEALEAIQQSETTDEHRERLGDSEIR